MLCVVVVIGVGLMVGCVVWLVWVLLSYEAWFVYAFGIVLVCFLLCCWEGL